MVMKMIDKKKLVKHYFNDLTNYYEEYRKLTIVDIEKLVYIEVKLEMVVKKFGSNKELTLLKGFRELYKVFKDDVVTLVNDKYFKYEVFEYFKGSLERAFFKLRILKTEEDNIEVVKLKEIHLPILLKYNKKVTFRHSDENVIKAASKLGLLKCKELSLNFKNIKFYNFNNDEILNLELLFDFNIIKPIHETLCAVINNNAKYKIIYMPKTVNRFIVNRLPKLLDNFRFIKNKASDAEEIPIIFKEETLLDLDERDYNNIFKKYINNFKLKVGVEINSIDSFYYFIEKGFKVIIVNIDEVSNYDLSLNNFKGNIIHTLRLIRDVAGESKVRLIIKSWEICDKVVIDKIFILGFREYIYSRKVFNIVKETLTKFIKRRKNLQKNNKR